MIRPDVQLKSDAILNRQSVSDVKFEILIRRLYYYYEIWFKFIFYPAKYFIVHMTNRLYFIVYCEYGP
jgi:hypothetical protein